MRLHWLVAYSLFLSFSFAFAQSSIQHFEPANWWTGMQYNHLQIVVYGEDIGYLHPSVSYPGVTLERTIKVPNDNYLFLYVTINEDAKPGEVVFTFSDKTGVTLEHTFQLLARERSAEDIEGFGTEDVMYLITPDRFVNGNPGNDQIAGMKETPDRAFKGGRHGGDLAGIRQSLDYIIDMGFTAIWLNPVLENDMDTYSYHGYAATDFYKVDRRFGSNEEYQSFCDLAREKGVKIIMDMIVNHCGSEHWFVKDAPTPDWINFNNTFVPTSHRRHTNQDIHASAYDKKHYSDGWFVETMPDLNQRNDLMADYLIQNTLWWIEYAGLAGIRMDTYPYPDKHFMTDWTCAVMNEYPDFNIVGEEWVTNPAIVSYWQAGKQNSDGYTSCLPSLMDFPIQDAVTKALVQEEKTYGSGWITAYEMLALDFLYPTPDDLVIFPDNHDMDRFFTQVKGDLSLFKMGMTYFATMRGVPQIYYGTEVLMENDAAPGDHGIIRTDFPGGWEGDAVSAITGKGLTDTQKEAQSYLRKLLNWRKETPVIHHGKLMQFVPHEGVYAYCRYDDGNKIFVFFNKNSEPTTVDTQRYAELLQGATVAKNALTGELVQLGKTLVLPPQASLILEI